MAVLITKTMEELNEEHKLVYPLFQKALKAHQAITEENISNQLSSEYSGVDVFTTTAKAVPKRVNNKTRSTTKLLIDYGGIGEPTSPAIRVDHGELLELDPNNARRKRRKTASPEVRSDTDGVKIGLGGNGQTTLNLARLPPLAKHDQEFSLNVESGLDQCSKLSPNAQDTAATQWCQGSFFSRKEAIATPAAVNHSTNSSQTASKHRETPSAKVRRDGNDEGVLPNISADDAKPERILRLNPKTGTIGSPPSKKLSLPENTIAQQPPKRRGRKAKSLTVTIRYGPGHPLPASTGPQIDRILKSSGKNSLTKGIEVLEPPKSAKPGPTHHPKALHPLFLGKTARAAIPIAAPESLDEATITDLSKDSDIVDAGDPPKHKPIQPVTRKSASAFSALGAPGKAMKFLCTMEPAWPWQDMVHIRGQDFSAREAQYSDDTIFDLPSTAKKSKYQAVEVLADEDILNRLANQLCTEEVMKNVREISPEKFAVIPSCLRLPSKHLESGLALQRRVRKELRTRLPIPFTATWMTSSEVELSRPSTAATQVHPALTGIYGSICSSLSAFDKGECETQAWIHKYSPKSAAEVLQVGKEGYLLKEWLQTLTVKAVDSGSMGRPQSRSSSVSRKSGTMKSENRLPKKRKSKKLEGFIVSSDDEEDDMDEISEPEDDVSTRGSQGLLKKTVIRAGDLARGAKDSRRLTNAIVISGPYGCGKTAAVYAVAKELEFEVFEINASSRRSGKDILEKVGDMTRNHLVQRLQHQTTALPIDEDAQRASEVLANEIKSGRQGTMNSFFKPQALMKPKVKPKKSTAANAALDSKMKPQSQRPPKQQKQSLILLEEVDVLYEEDKQFWATVVNLIAQSKRPIIMTCNDESLVPFQTLSLHAIIRFIPPPVDLAVDYMLLIAACEGHVVKREAVKALYESQNMDLRASLTELNFWCQFAIGDCKNGLGWYYSRWPTGKDVDEQGDTIRVVSEGSLETGMGWLSQDFLKDKDNSAGVEEEILHEAWDGWHLDVEDLQHRQNMPASTEMMPQYGLGNRDALYTFADISDALSAADAFSGATFAPKHQILIDSTLPQISAKVREDYILGRELLEASPVVNYNSLGTDISLWIKSRAREYIPIDQQSSNGVYIQKTHAQSTELVVQQLIRTSSSTLNAPISRQDFSLAFDPISEPEKTSLYNTGVFEASIFDGTAAIIATDVAPYIRSIVSYDARLQEERARMSNLLSEGGKTTKRMRTTRAAMSALEGGARNTTRRDKYFGNDLNPYFVLKTGRKEWLDAVAAETACVSRDERRSEGGDSEAAVGAGGVVEDESVRDELMKSSP